MIAKLTLPATLVLLGMMAHSSAQAGFLDNVLATAAAAPDCGTPAPVTPSCAPPVCCGPTITYNHVCIRRVCCCKCDPPIETILVVKDPSCCTACPVDIPVCLPSCCTGEPTVNCWNGLFGRGVVRYDYCCGLSIKIIFRLNGDIAVTYIGGLRFCSDALASRGHPGGRE